MFHLSTVLLNSISLFNVRHFSYISIFYETYTKSSCTWFKNNKLCNANYLLQSSLSKGFYKQTLFLFSMLILAAYFHRTSRGSRTRGGCLPHKPCEAWGRQGDPGLHSTHTIWRNLGKVIQAKCSLAAKWRLYLLLNYLVFSKMWVKTQTFSFSKNSKCFEIFEKICSFHLLVY